MNENITLRQLRAFLMVAHERSFTKAAARLNVTQSALTNAIKALEAELGLRLFDRTTRVVMPTSSGARFAVLAERLLGDIGQAVDDLRADAARQQGLVIVAATATMINNMLIPALSRLSARYPGVRVRLIEELTDGAIKRLRSGEVDLAFTTMEHQEADVDTIPVMKDRFEVVCSRRHPLAQAKQPLHWSVFDQHEAIGLSHQSGIRTLLEQHTHGQRAVQRMRYEVSSVAGLTSMVENNLGIAAVPGLIAETMTSKLVARRPLRPALWRSVSLATRRGRSPTPAAGAFIGAVLPHVRDAEQKTVVSILDTAKLKARGFDLDD